MSSTSAKQLIGSLALAAAVLAGTFLVSPRAEAEVGFGAPSVPTLAACLREMPSGVKTWALDFECQSSGQ